MKVDLYIKSFLARRQRFYPDKEITEVADMIRKGMVEDTPCHFICREVDSFLRHYKVKKPYNHINKMVCGAMTQININEGIVAIKK